MNATMLDVAAKATVLFAAASVADRFLRRAPASARHIVWTSVLVAALALPVLTLALPALRLPLPAGAVPEILARADAAPAKGAAPGSVAPSVEAVPHAAINWSNLVLTLWLSGLALGMARLGTSVAVAERLRRCATPPPAGIAARAPEATVLLAAGQTMPMTAGLLHPTILLPETAISWPPERLDAVLQHELAHVHRRDTLWQLLGSIACAVYWPHPLAWHCKKKSLEYRERAADDAVLETGAAAQEYAGSLLEIARTLSAPRFCEGAAMARPKELEGRLLAILDDAQNRRPATRGLLLTSAAATLMLVVSLAALKPVFAAAQQDAAEITVQQAREQLVAAERASGPQSVGFGRALVTMGRALAYSGDEGAAAGMIQRAVETLQQVAPGDPAFAEALYRAGIYAQQAEDKTPAVKLYQRALEAARASGNQRILARVAHNLAILTESSDPAQAEQYLQESISNETTPALLSQSLDLYAGLLERMGKAAEAEAAKRRTSEVLSRVVTLPEEPLSAGVSKIGKGASAPRLNHETKREPEYTLEARSAKIQGTVVLTVEIGADGVPRNVHVRRSLGLGLDQNAVRAVESWRFESAKDEANQPVAVAANVEVNFRLL